MNRTYSSSDIQISLQSQNMVKDVNSLAKNNNNTHVNRLTDTGANQHQSLTPTSLNLDKKQDISRYNTNFNLKQEVGGIK
jgi:hypothetical protein